MPCLFLNRISCRKSRSAMFPFLFRVNLCSGLPIDTLPYISSTRMEVSYFTQADQFDLIIRPAASYRQGQSCSSYRAGLAGQTLSCCQTLAHLVPDEVAIPHRFIIIVYAYFIRLLQKRKEGHFAPLNL